MHQVYAAILIVVITGCSSNETKVNKTIALKLIETRSLPLDSLTSSYNRTYQYIESENMIVFFNSVNSSLYFYDYESQNLQRKLTFAKSGPNGIGSRVNSFYYHNSDSIFIHNYYGNNIILFNASAKLIRKYSLISETFGTELPLTGHVAPMVVNDGKLYLNNGGKCNRAKSDFPPPNIIEIDIQTGGINYHLNYPEEDYYPYNGWPGSLCNLYNTFNSAKGEFIYSYAMSDEILVTNHSNHKETKDFSSHVVLEETFEPVNLVIKSPTDVLQASSKFAQYGAIYYDPYRQFYLRFANSRVPESRLEENRFKPDQNIIVQNSNFEYVGEVSNFGGSFWLFFTSEGVNQIAPNKEDEDLIDINIYAYELN